MTPRACLAVLLLLAAPPALAQHAGHGEGHLGASVMPFDIGRALHVFTLGPSGGVQSVLSRDGDPVQVALIRAHLRKEAEAFARGDYADPAAIHGAGMPGLQELQAGVARVRVAYESVSGGARLHFSSRDPALVEALHRWFAAQLSDHGADATMGR